MNATDQVNESYSFREQRQILSADRNLRRVIRPEEERIVIYYLFFFKHKIRTFMTDVVISKHSKYINRS